MEHLPSLKCQIFYKVSKRIGTTYRCFEIFWHTETVLFAHFLEAPAAAMNSVFGQQECNWQYYKGEQPKDAECCEGANPKEGVNLMLHICDNFDRAKFARLSHWSTS